jgi:tRNA A37 threonylcarbamoyltransferase TsaD
MMNKMCLKRGAEFFLLPKKFMGNSSSMIACTALVMLKGGSKTPLKSPRFDRLQGSDDLAVTWA